MRLFEGQRGRSAAGAGAVVECTHEAEVVQVTLSGRWPEGCEASLLEHVSGCAVCGEVAEVARVLGQGHGRMRQDVRVPAAGQVWWRAAVRARLEATQAAARPMTWLYTVSAVLGGVGAVVAAGAGAERLAGLLGRASDWLATRTPEVAPMATGLMDLVTSALQRGLPLVLALAFCLLAAPIALYIALRDE